MKTFNQFKEDNQHLNEGLPLVPLIGAGLKLGGKALAGYSALSAAGNLAKGKPKRAAIDALGAVPGGKVFKGMRAVGASKNLSKLGSASQSIARYGTDNPFSRTVDAVYNKGFEYAGKAYKKIRGK